MYFYALQSAAYGRALFCANKRTQDEAGPAQCDQGTCCRRAHRQPGRVAPPLVKRGFEVTQATLSRDIHELHLYKGPNGYAVPNGIIYDEDDSLPRTSEMLRSFGLR